MKLSAKSLRQNLKIEVAIRKELLERLESTDKEILKLTTLLFQATERKTE